jgi:hypothetical protein
LFFGCRDLVRLCWVIFLFRHFLLSLFLPSTAGSALGGGGGDRWFPTQGPLFYHGLASESSHSVVQRGEDGEGDHAGDCPEPERLVTHAASSGHSQ